MALLLAATAVIGLPVVSIADGEDVAEVRDVVYDPSAGRLVGMTLNKRGFLSGRSQDVLSAAGIAAIGRDAVMIEDTTCLDSRGDSADGAGASEANRNVLGDDVLTEGGASLGVVRDLIVMVGGTGEVVGYRIETPDGREAYIPLPAQLAVSGAALVVPEATESFVRDDLVGLAGAVDEFRSRLDL